MITFSISRGPISFDFLQILTNIVIQLSVMKKLLLFFVLFTCSNQFLYAQCGQIGLQTIVSSQEQLEGLAQCELFNGDLLVSSTNITNLDALSQLSVVNGNFYLINTAVTDLSPLSSLNNAVQIIIQGNTSLNSCCALLQFSEAAQIGSVLNVSYINNGTFCDDNNSLMLSCLGYIVGCTDSVAINYNSLATVSNDDCEYYCPETYNDMQDYSCDGSSFPENCDAVISNKPSDGGGHYNFPIGLCYDQTPPSSGPHRPMWGRWGAYEYMPPQRYIHNLEHGGIAFLYNPCAPQYMIDSLRALACSRPIDDGGDFRWVLTPYVGLPTNIAVVAWEWSYSNNCFDSNGINDFIEDHYRNAPEDFYYNGSYDTLYLGKCEAFGCNDESALNFGSVNLIDNGSCIYPVLDTQLISLRGGWSLFSTYIQAQYPSMDSVFNTITDHIIIVKNNTGAAFLPAWGMDLAMENGQGYQSKLTVDSDLIVFGEQLLPEETPIPLVEGWNMIAYLRVNPADCFLVFEDIIESITMVKDGSGNVYFPAWGFSNIGDMVAGQGYQVKTTSPSSLEYLANDLEY